VDAEHAPAEQFTEDEQPRPPRHTGTVPGPVHHPYRRRDLEQEGDGQGRAQPRATERGGGSEQDHRPHRDEHRGPFRLPQVRQAERLFGDPDYLLRIVARDLDSFATLRDQRLATLPGVHRLTSTIVMKRIVENRPLPLATRGG